MSGMAPDTDDKLARLEALVASLAQTVGAVVERMDAQPAVPASTAPAPALTLELTQDDGYAALVPMNDENQGRRLQLAVDLGVLGTAPGAELVRHGARGFYRRLEREEGQERVEFRRDHARRLVEDAQLEDVREAQDMGADLLKFWDQEDEDRFMDRGGVDVEARVK